MVTASDLVLVANLIFLVPAALIGLLAMAIGGFEMTTIIRRDLHLR